MVSRMTSLWRRAVVIPVLWLAVFAIAPPASAQFETVCRAVSDAENGRAYPVSPWDCSPYTGPFNNPAIFFSPHPDDDSLAMAGAIHQALAAGRTVVVELMTRGTGSNALRVLSGEDPHADSTHPQGCKGPAFTHTGAGAYRLRDAEGLGDARVREFLDAMRRLGVQAVTIHDYPDSGLQAAKVTQRAQFWMSQGFTGMSFFGTAGNNEYFTTHLDHIAVHDGVANSGFAPRTFLSSYIGFICDAARRDAYARQNWPRIVRLDAKACSAKKNAMAAYRVWEPPSGRFAVGWIHSSSGLFVAYSSAPTNDCNEYVTDEAGAAPAPPTGNP